MAKLISLDVSGFWPSVSGDQSAWRELGDPIALSWSLSLGNTVIKAFVFQGLTQRMDYSPRSILPSLGARNAGYAGLKLGGVSGVLFCKIAFKKPLPISLRKRLLIISRKCQEGTRSKTRDVLNRGGDA